MCIRHNYCLTSPVDNVDPLSSLSLIFNNEMDVLPFSILQNVFIFSRNDNLIFFQHASVEYITIME